MIMYCYISHGDVVERDCYNIKDRMKLLNNNNYLLFYGGEKIIENEHVVHLSCNDQYCHLPEKMNCVYKYIANNLSIDFVVKMDRTLMINKLIDQNDINSDYCGHIISWHPDNGNHHLNRCEDGNDWNKQKFVGKQINYCCGGGGYVLSKKSVDLIAKDDTVYKENIYEDYYVGFILKLYGIEAKQIDVCKYFYDKDHKYIFG